MKLLGRIVAPDLPAEDSGEAGSDAVDYSKVLYDHTYGITSDPLTQFACVFASLIHDADHSGVPNGQLARENAALAAFYHEQSVAEQNSVELSWKLLMDREYTNLRRVIYANASEFRRFREIVVNTVMATDIMDKELKAMRNRQWDRAFQSSGDNRDEKATVVINHLIQASDVAHTMQHWQVYRKWNERLFEEMLLAYRIGRADRDPAEFWYDGELGFFDFYIIPLARKLKDCGVFGVSSDEYLNYAEQNRQQWEQQGKAIVAEMADRGFARIPDDGRW
jgi:3'5'-cyclic nucleotide phosphodiesterase